MKILYIINRLGRGGAQRLLLDTCKQLNNKNNVEYRLLILEDLNEYKEFLDSVPYTIVKVNFKLSLFGRKIFDVSALQSIINEFDPDIIHSNLFFSEIVSRTCNYTKAKWFSHCHDNMPQFQNLCFSSFTNKTKLTNYCEKRYLFKRYKMNGGTYFIAIGEDTKKYFEKTAKPYTVIKLINAIDYNKFFKSKNILNKSQIVLTNTGSFVNKKNQKFILDIAKELLKRGIEFKINLLGAGPDLKAVKEKAILAKLDNQIIFHGSVNNVQEYLWESDIYLHTATYEPLGLVLLEAMAAGLPVVTLDGKGNRDLIEQGKNGYMIYEQDAEVFAQTIIDLWNDKQKYLEMSTYAQEYAKQYDIKPYVDKLLVLYQNAIDGKSK